jgi:hypothetical protein
VAEAAAGTGIVSQYDNDHFIGLGPDYGMEVTQIIKGTGLSLVTSADGATMLGRLHQTFQETAVGPVGTFLFGQTLESHPQDVPMLDFFVGINWRPPGWRCLTLSVGYDYEYWWSVGRFSPAISRADFSAQGILMRAGFNY